MQSHCTCFVLLNQFSFTSISTITDIDVEKYYHIQIIFVVTALISNPIALSNSYQIYHINRSDDAYLFFDSKGVVSKILRPPNILKAVSSGFLNDHFSTSFRHSGGGVNS